MKPQLVIFGWILVAVVATTGVNAQLAADRRVPATVADIERTLVDVIGRAERSVVAISRATAGQSAQAMQGQASAFGEFRRNAATESAASIVGAGIIIDPDGTVLTQYLAVREGDEHTVTTNDGTGFRAAIRGADPRSGLAILKIDASAGERQRRDEPAVPASFPAIRLGDATTLRKGQFVVAIGNPYAIVSDGQPTASWGMVTNLARKAPGGTNFNNAPGPNNDHRTTLHHLGTLIQTDASLGWSAGGGALVDMRGELIGVTTTAAAIAGHEQPAGYAIPLNALMRRAIETLRQGREVEYGMLGVGFSEMAINPNAQGFPRLGISQVYPGGPAARGGLRAGDIITRVGSQPVDDIDDVQLAVSAMPPSTSTTIEYERDGRTATSTVTLAKLAVAGTKIATRRPNSWRGIRVDYATALDAAQLAQAISSGAYDEEGCVLVAEVEPHSVAWRAGVRPGMFISHIGGQRVSTPQEFRSAARKVAAEKLDIRLTQPVAPGEGARPQNSP